MIPDERGKSRTSAGSEMLNAAREVAYQRERRLGVMCVIPKTLPVIPITPTLSDDGRSRIRQYALPPAFGFCLAALSNRSSALVSRGLKRRFSVLPSVVI